MQLEKNEVISFKIKEADNRPKCLFSQSIPKRLTAQSKRVTQRIQILNLPVIAQRRKWLRSYI
jgi:glutaredoxin-related protein